MQYSVPTVPVTRRHAQVAGCCLDELPAVQPKPPDSIAARLAASATARSRSKLVESASFTGLADLGEPAAASASKLPVSSSYNDMASLERETLDSLEERTRELLEKANVGALEGVVEAKAHRAKRLEAKAARDLHREQSLEAWKAQRARAGIRWKAQSEPRLSEQAGAAGRGGRGWAACMSLLYCTSCACVPFAGARGARRRDCRAGARALGGARAGGARPAGALAVEVGARRAAVSRRGRRGGHLLTPSERLGPEGRRPRRALAACGWRRVRG